MTWGYKRDENTQTPSEVADIWEAWCSETPWSILLRQFGELGGKIIYWGGVPRSTSTIPLCFVLYYNGKHVDYSRLKDIREAVAELQKKEGRRE